MDILQQEIQSLCQMIMIVLFVVVFAFLGEGLQNPKNLMKSVGLVEKCSHKETRNFPYDFRELIDPLKGGQPTKLRNSHQTQTFHFTNGTIKLQKGDVFYLTQHSKLTAKTSFSLYIQCPQRLRLILLIIKTSKQVTGSF